MQKILGNPVVFVLLYILFMLPTYYLPYVGSNSAVIGALGQAGAAASDANPLAGVNPGEKQGQTTFNSECSST